VSRTQLLFEWSKTYKGTLFPYGVVGALAEIPRSSHPRDCTLQRPTRIQVALKSGDIRLHVIQTVSSGFLSVQYFRVSYSRVGNWRWNRTNSDITYAWMNYSATKESDTHSTPPTVLHLRNLQALISKHSEDTSNHTIPNMTLELWWIHGGTLDLNNLRIHFQNLVSPCGNESNTCRKIYCSSQWARIPKQMWMWTVYSRPWQECRKASRLITQVLPKTVQDIVSMEFTHRFIAEYRKSWQRHWGVRRQLQFSALLLSFASDIPRGTELYPNSRLLFYVMPAINDLR
jgi:hypothetical protein